MNNKFFYIKKNHRNFISPALFVLFTVFLFFSSLLAMRYSSASSLIEDIFFSIPVFWIFLIWFLKSYRLVFGNESDQTSKDIFIRDIFIISYGFYCAALISMVFQYNNIDLKGWWPFYLYLCSLTGLIFAVCFSLVAKFNKYHKFYTNCFALLIILVFSNIWFFPKSLTVPIIGVIDFYWIIILFFMLLHIFICLVYKCWQKSFNS